MMRCDLSGGIQSGSFGLPQRFHAFFRADMTGVIVPAGFLQQVQIPDQLGAFAGGRDAQPAPGCDSRGIVNRGAGPAVGHVFRVAGKENIRFPGLLQCLAHDLLAGDPTPSSENHRMPSSFMAL